MGNQREVLAGAVLDLHQQAERDDAIALLRESLNYSACGAQGPFKTKVREFLERCSRPVTRFERQRAIERELVAFNPDTVEALELLASFERALTDRYGEARTTDLRKCLGESGEALSEVEASNLDPADVCSGRVARQMERVQR